MILSNYAAQIPKTLKITISMLIYIFTIGFRLLEETIVLTGYRKSYQQYSKMYKYFTFEPR
jgi:hypothetical protein